MDRLQPSLARFWRRDPPGETGRSGNREVREQERFAAEQAHAVKAAAYCCEFALDASFPRLNQPTNGAERTGKNCSHLEKERSNA